MKALLISRSNVQARLMSRCFSEAEIEVPTVVSEPNLTWTEFLNNINPVGIDLVAIEFDTNPMMALTILDDLRAHQHFYTKPVFFFSKSISQVEIDNYLSHLSVGFIHIPIGPEDLKLLTSSYIDEFEPSKTGPLHNPLPQEVRSHHLLKDTPNWVPSDWPLAKASESMWYSEIPYFLCRTEDNVGLFSRKALHRALMKNADFGTETIGPYLSFDVPHVPHDSPWHVGFTLMHTQRIQTILLEKEGDVIGLLTLLDYDRVMLRELFLSYWK